MALPAPLLNKHQLADLLGKSVTFVEESCRKRRWPFLMVGHEYRFTDRQVEEIFASFEVEPKARQTREARAPHRDPEPPASVPVPVLSIASAVPQGNPHRSRRYRPPHLDAVS